MSIRARSIFKLRGLLTLALLCAVRTTAQAQDHSEWQSLAVLHAGDKVRLTVKSGSSEGIFQSWTPERVTVGAVTARKEDVLKVELYIKGGGMGHGKKALIGALIGFGGGFAIGVSTGGCQQGHFLGPCFGRGELGGVLGGLGALIGAGIGAALPAHPQTKQIVYLAKP
jgi:hypothetical protein